MKILVVSRYKTHIATHVVPFVEEQVAALRGKGCDAELFLLKGNYLKQWIALRRKVLDYKPDVIHAHYGLSCLLANLVTRRVPVVSTYHGSDINLPKVRLFSKIAMWLSAWNIFVSKRNMMLAGAKEGDKCSLIPCGVELSDNQLQQREDARRKLGWNPTDKKILFAGAFDNQVKNPELAFAVIDELKNKGVNAELVELKGYNRDQVNTLMCAANCLLMTSKTEGSPQVIKEAMACGCPIVSVDVGDVKERTKGVEGCYVVSADGSESRIIDLLREALEKAIAFIGKTNGRKYIEEFGLANDMVATRMMEVYNNILIAK